MLRCDGIAHNWRDRQSRMGESSFCIWIPRKVNRQRVIDCVRCAGDGYGTRHVSSWEELHVREYFYFRCAGAVVERFVFNDRESMHARCCTEASSLRIRQCGSERFVGIVVGIVQNGHPESSGCHACVDRQSRGCNIREITIRCRSRAIHRCIIHANVVVECKRDLYREHTRATGCEDCFCGCSFRSGQCYFKWRIQLRSKSKIPFAAARTAAEGNLPVASAAIGHFERFRTAVGKVAIVVYIQVVSRSASWQRSNIKLCIVYIEAYQHIFCVSCFLEPPLAVDA